MHIVSKPFVLLLFSCFNGVFDFCLSHKFVMLTADLSCLTGVYLGSSGQILCWCPPGSLAAVVCDNNCLSSLLMFCYCMVCLFVYLFFSLPFVCLCRIPQLLTCLVRREGQKILNLLCNIGRVHPQVC